MQFLLKKIIQVLFATLLSLPWKQIIGQLYIQELFPLLQKKVADTESKWDDTALTTVDRIVRDLLGLPAVELQHHAEVRK